MPEDVLPIKLCRKANFCQAYGVTSSPGKIMSNLRKFVSFKNFVKIELCIQNPFCAANKSNAKIFLKNAISVTQSSKTFFMATI